MATNDDEVGDEWGVESAVDDPEELRVLFTALDSFNQYGRHAHLNCTHLRRQAFYRLPQQHWQMLAAPPFNYLDTLNNVDKAIECNAQLARAIVKSGVRTFTSTERKHPGVMPEEWAGVAQHSDIEKARSTLRQFYRDWSEEGREEREASYYPVYSALRTEELRLEAEAEQDGRAQRPEPRRMKVLVPGAGLGRLVFELCAMGYITEGNEISYHQLLASSYILNSCESVGKHTIYPWIHSFSNHESRANQFRSYRVPDLIPAAYIAEAKQQRGGGRVGTMEMSAADFLCLYSDAKHAGVYDAVAAVFFLDTAPNVIRYLEVILHCLRPGGILVNVGPLLWHWENHVPDHHGYDGEADAEGGDRDDNAVSLGIADPGNFELTDDEVVALAEKIGFVIEKRVKGVSAPYMHDAKSMLQTVYRASYWVARKPEKPEKPEKEKPETAAGSR